MFRAATMHYEMAERTRGFAYGGPGAIHLLAQQTGPVGAIDRGLHLLKRHLPHHESDHVLNIAYNILCHGDCLEDLERLRTFLTHTEWQLPSFPLTFVPVWGSVSALWTGNV